MSGGILHRIDADLIEPQRLAGAVIDQTLIERRRRPEHRGQLTAREALVALKFEALVVALAAQNVARGISLSDDDRARLLVAWARIDTIAAEATR
jgi:hypothetical protein